MDIILPSPGLYYYVIHHIIYKYYYYYYYYYFADFYACKTKDCSAHGVGNFTQEEDMDYLSLPIRSTYNTHLCQLSNIVLAERTQSWTLPTVSKNEEERERIILRTSNIY